MYESINFVSLLFPNVTQLDLTGPVQLFSRLPGANIDLAWRTIEPVRTDSGFSILPATTFADAPQADVLMVPGGQGAFELMDDPLAGDFVGRQAANARYVTNVCTGARFLNRLASSQMGTSSLAAESPAESTSRCRSRLRSMTTRQRVRCSSRWNTTLTRHSTPAHPRALRPTKSRFNAL